MPTRPQVLTEDLRGQLVILGSGTSVGVPAVGCGCTVCRERHPKNQRTRCAIVLGLEQGNLLIDTPPDLRSQLLRERIGIVHAVLYTHEHADHLFGLDDLRLFPFYLGHAVPLYCEPRVEECIRRAYAYAFADLQPTHAGAVPQLEFQSIGTEPFEVLGERVTPVRLLHGPRFEVLGFRLGNIAYCTDTNAIPDESRDKLRELDVLILDALRHRPHATHYCLEEAIEVAHQLGAKRTIFTHLSHEVDYPTDNVQLPPGMELAYDGLRVPLPIS